MENNPTLKIVENQKVMIKLKSNTPFKEGTNTGQYGTKEWFGYNVLVQEDGNEVLHTWFASRAVHSLIQASGVKSDELCSIEFKHFTNDEGKEIHCWLLNERTTKQWIEERQGLEQSIQTATAPDDSEWKQEIEKQINIIGDILKQHANTINDVVKAINNK
tara:strand:- start:18977 stop:19459 length:483 start_codon:yes stop_codon:yes gene_type:complete